MAERDLVGSVVLTRYRVIGKVASTATADIYEAEHVSLGTHIALKVLANNDASSEVAARFLREGKTLGMFRHPNIVELLEVGRLEAGALFLATELVRGQSLRELIQQGALEPRRSLAIAHEVLDALGHAHGMGIVHRGMRPETVMVADDGRVKVLDFGVAKLATDTAAVLGENKLTRTGIAVLGDPRYTAPEVARAGAIDARADLYSVGAMLKEMVPEPSTPQLQLLLNDSTQASADLRYHTAAEMRDAVDGAIASLDDLGRAGSSSGIVATPTSSTLSQGWSMDSAPTAAASPIEPEPSSGARVGSSPHLPGVTERPSKQHVVPVAPSASAPFVAPSGFQQVDSAAPWTGAPSLTASEHGRPPAPLASTTKRPPGRVAADLLELAKRHRYIVGGALGAIVLVILIVALAGGGSKAGKAAHGDDPRSLLKRGHEELAAGHREEALAAYERAIAGDKALAANPEIREDAKSIAEGKDAVAAVIALELLASRLSPPGKDVIIAIAATGKVADVRQRAFAIAERDGFADQIDRVASLSLDLAQATTCEDRRVAIGKLRATADKRAVAPLKKAKVYKCVERDATDAIAELEAKP